MYILTGSFLEFENAFLLFEGEINDRARAIEITKATEDTPEVVRELGSVVLSTYADIDVDTLKNMSPEELNSLQPKKIKEVSFKVFSDSLQYEFGVDEGRISTLITELSNSDSALPEEIINFVIENDPRFLNLKLI